MKKILAVAVAALVSFGAFAGDWQNTLGAGLSAQKSSIHVAKSGTNLGIDSLGKLHQWATDFDLTYFLVNTANGLSFKADFAIGAAFPDASWIGSSDTGLNLGGDFGIGYSFLHSQRVTLGLFAMFGLDYTKYSWTYRSSNVFNENEGAKFEMEYGIFSYKIGADLACAFRFTEQLGIFGSFGARWICGGSTSLSATGSAYGKSLSVDYDWDVKAKGLCLIPTLGICWTF